MLSSAIFFGARTEAGKPFRRRHVASQTGHDLEEVAAIASTAFAMGSRKRSADFGDRLVKIIIQPRDLLLLFAESFCVRCRCGPAGGGQLVKGP
jgi:hypothetical protein